MPVFSSCYGCIHSANPPNTTPCLGCIGDVTKTHYVSFKQKAEEKHASQTSPLEEAVLEGLNKPGTLEALLSITRRVLLERGVAIGLNEAETMANAYLFSAFEQVRPLMHQFDFPIVDFRRLRNKIADVIRTALEKDINGRENKDV